MRPKAHLPASIYLFVWCTAVLLPQVLQVDYMPVQYAAVNQGSFWTFSDLCSLHPLCPFPIYLKLHFVSSPVCFEQQTGFAWVHGHESQFSFDGAGKKEKRGKYRRVMSTACLRTNTTASWGTAILGRISNGLACSIMKVRVEGQPAWGGSIWLQDGVPDEKSATSTVQGQAFRGWTCSAPPSHKCGSALRT